MCLWKLKMAKQQNQKLDPHTFHVTPTCGDALPGFREGGIVVQILCALPQAIASESPKVWKKFTSFHWQNAEVWLGCLNGWWKGIHSISTEAMGFEGRSLSHKVSGSSAIWYDCHTTRVLWSSAGLVCFVKVDDGSLVPWAGLNGFRRVNFWEDSMASLEFGQLDQATWHQLLQMRRRHTPTTWAMQKTLVV